MVQLDLLSMQISPQSLEIFRCWINRCSDYRLSDIYKCIMDICLSARSFKSIKYIKVHSGLTGFSCVPDQRTLRLWVCWCCSSGASKPPSWRDPERSGLRSSAAGSCSCPCQKSHIANLIKEKQGGVCNYSWIRSNCLKNHTCKFYIFS